MDHADVARPPSSYVSSLATAACTCRLSTSRRCPVPGLGSSSSATASSEAMCKAQVTAGGSSSGPANFPVSSASAGSGHRSTSQTTIWPLSPPAAASMPSRLKATDRSRPMAQSNDRASFQAAVS